MTPAEKTLKSLLGVLVAILISNTTLAVAKNTPIDKSITLKPKNTTGLQLDVNQSRECSYPKR